MNYFDAIKKASVLIGAEEPSSFSSTTDEEYIQIKEAINAVNRQVCGMQNNRWMFKERKGFIELIEGQFEYPMPDGTIRRLKISSKTYPLAYEYDYTLLVGSPSGTPDRYATFDGKIQLYPIPDATCAGLLMSVEHYTNLYAKTAEGIDKSNMTLETDTSIIPEQYRDVLIYGAARDWRSDPTRGKYQHYNNRFLEVLQSMKQNLRRSTQEIPHVSMQGREGSTQDILDRFFWIGQ